MTKALILASLLFTLWQAGCVTAPTKGRADLLDFLVDGKTTKEEVLLKLGQPSGRFERERILTYRLGADPNQQSYYVVEREPTATGWPTWRMAKNSLVLVFDDQDLLQKHCLVKVN